MAARLGLQSAFSLRAVTLSAHHSLFRLFNVRRVFHGEQDIGDNGYNAGGRDRVVENETDKAGELGHGLRVSGHADPENEGQAHDQDVPLAESRLGNHFDAVNQNHSEHRDDGPAQDGVGDRGENRSQLGEEAGDHQDESPGGNTPAVHHSCHGHDARVLTEGRVGQSVEEALI